jgi:hypothetical protein
MQRSIDYLGPPGLHRHSSRHAPSNAQWRGDAWVAVRLLLHSQIQARAARCAVGMAAMCDLLRDGLLSLVPAAFMLLLVVSQEGWNSHVASSTEQIQHRQPKKRAVGGKAGSLEGKGGVEYQGDEAVQGSQLEEGPDGDLGVGMCKGSGSGQQGIGICLRVAVQQAYPPTNSA